MQNTKGTVFNPSQHTMSNTIHFYSSECENIQVEVRLRPSLWEHSDRQRIAGMLHCAFGHCWGRQRHNLLGRISTENIARSRAISGKSLRCNPQWYVVLFCRWSYSMGVNDLLGRRNAMYEVQMSFLRVTGLVKGFTQSPHHKDALYPNKVEQWATIAEVSSSSLWHI